MKPLIQKLPLSEDTSFVARTYRTPNFEVSWHKHLEYELILFKEGAGMSFIGNHVGSFNVGDVYFLGSNLPHTFQKQEHDLITSAVVVQFLGDFWGPGFIALPESAEISQLYERSMQGLKITGHTRACLQPMIRELEFLHGFPRIIRLCECLNLIARSKECLSLSTQEITALNPKEQTRIDRIFQYTIDSFKGAVSLQEVAEVACMSVPAFCNYFKRSTKKTYIDFLNEIRIGYACKLLIDTELIILHVCYESGYNTLANFNRQFLKIKGMTPSQYRKKYRNQV